MLNYGKLILSRAFRGFALRIDLFYAVASVILAGLTGSKERPLGALTPFELARYLLVAMAFYALFRLLLLAPYRIWKEQTATIGDLQGELAKPQRRGAEEIARIRAEKKVELAAALHEHHWEAVNGEEPLMSHMRYTKINRLLGQVNASQEFKWLLAEFIETCKFIRMKEGDGEERRQRAWEIIRVLGDHLHGECDDATILQMIEDLKL